MKKIVVDYFKQQLADASDASDASDGPEIRSKQHVIQALKEPDEALWALQKKPSHRCSSQVETWVETWKLPEKILSENLWKPSRLDG